MDSLVGNMDLKENLKQQLENAVSNSNGFLNQKSTVALAEFEKMGFPTTRNEEWQYTNLSPILKNEFNLSSSHSLTAAHVKQYLIPSLEGNIIVIVNGVFDKTLSTIQASEDVLEVKNISEYSIEFIEKYFAKKVSVNDAFTALNTANANETLVIKIPKGKLVSQPVYIYYLNTASENTFVQPRLLVVAEENSQVKISEIYQNIGTAIAFTNSVTEIYLEKDAHFTYYKILPNTDETYHVGTTQVVHLAKSVFSATTVSLGGTLVRNNLNIVLDAEHCDSTLYGLYVTNGNQHVDNHTLVDHAKPNCLSNELYKGVLNGKSVGVFNGKIFVREDAQKTNAFQSNKNILLSGDAAMNTKPQLEIFADDVKCSHGATIGQLDDEPLFYLRSRGLSEASARALLVTAFAQDVIEHISIEPLKALLIEKLGEVL